MDRSLALPIAEKLIAFLSPACEEIVFAGSLRRGVDQVTDLDIVLLPKQEPAPHARAVFGQLPPKVYRWKIDQLIGELADSDEIFIRKNGPRLKKFRIRESLLDVDLSIVYPPARFGVILALKTGPADFSHWLVSRRRGLGGALPNGFRIQGGAVYLGEDKAKDLESLPSIGFDQERAFFDWLELGWIPPAERVAEWGKFFKAREPINE